MTHIADFDQTSFPEAAGLRISDRKNFAFQIFAMSKLLTRAFDERAQAMSLHSGDTLTAAQWQMLGTIRANIGANQREIADILEISPVTAGQTIDRLERSKWVERRLAPGDRRVRHLHITEEGHMVLEKLGLFGDPETQRSILGMSVDDMDQLTSMLDIARRNLLGKNMDPLSSQAV